MALDPSIILQAGRGVTPLLTPAEIQEQQMNREVNGIKLAQVRQGAADDQAMRQIARTTGQEGLADAYFKAGMPKQAQEALKFQSEQQKAKIDQNKTRIEAGSKLTEALGGPLRFLAENPTVESAGAVLMHLNNTGLMSPEQVMSAKKQIDTNPTPEGIKQFAMMGVQAAMNADKQAARDVTTRGQDLTSQTSIANNANTVGATMRGQNMTQETALKGQEQRAALAGAAAVQKTAPKPIPATALKMQQEGLDAIATASGMNADLDAISKQIADKKLKFGPASNLANSALNAVGMSTEESRNFASFKSTLEKIRNDSLRLNKGVQTEGDAQRAWNELFQNINDTDLVSQRLAEVKRLNDRAVQLRKLDIDNVRVNYGHEPLDTTSYSNQPATLNGGNKTAAQPATKLSVGLVQDGFRYKGGDPKSQSSWEAVK